VDRRVEDAIVLFETAGFAVPRNGLRCEVLPREDFRYFLREAHLSQSDTVLRELRESMLRKLPGWTGGIPEEHTEMAEWLAERRTESCYGCAFDVLIDGEPGKYILVNVDNCDAAHSVEDTLVHELAHYVHQQLGLTEDTEGWARRWESEHHAGTGVASRLS
jgi:hypothetical protein